MENEILIIDGVKYDLNGFELANGTSNYKNVYFDSQKNLWGAYIGNDNLLDRPSLMLNISMHTDSREAAFYAQQFLENLDQNLKEFELMGSRNWNPNVKTPDFKYDSLDEPATGDIIIEKKKNIAKKLKDININEMFTDIQNPLYNKSLSIMEINTREALNVVLKKHNLSLKLLTKQQKDTIRPLITNETKNALQILNELEEIIIKFNIK